VNNLAFGILNTFKAATACCAAIRPTQLWK